MGSLFSKDKKQKNEERKSVGSAPSRLEGLDGTAPVPPEVPKRALTPDSATRQKGPSPVSVSAAGDSPSPVSTQSPTESEVRCSPVPNAFVICFEVEVLKARLRKFLHHKL